MGFLSDLLDKGSDQADVDPSGESVYPAPPQVLEDFAGLVTPYARWNVQGFSTELVGFWVLWQAEGGFEGLRNLGMSEATIWRRVRAFRDAFGQHPDDFELPGVVVDLDAYWNHPDGHGFIGNPAGQTVDP